ncbi:MAG: EAL domain-containing protein [Kangiellaceae bacterium]|nr:EAL domain-containing protein [Kangiellaceae bacterium]
MLKKIITLFGLMLLCQSCLGIDNRARQPIQQYQYLRVEFSSVTLFIYYLKVANDRDTPINTTSNNFDNSLKLNNTNSSLSERPYILLILTLLILAAFFFWFRTNRTLTLISILITALMVEQQIESVLTREQLDREQLEARLKLNLITAQLAGTLQTNLSMLAGFAAYISATPDLAAEDFNRYAKQLLRKNPLLINFASARDYKINYVYPIEGNEKAIGLNYREHKNQLKMVQLVIDSRQMMVVGPVNLVQGGTAFIGRAPVITQDGALWGLISAPIDAERFFEFANLEELSRGIILAIQNFDTNGVSGPVFYGDSSILENPNRATAEIQVGGGTWKITVATRIKERKTSANILSLRLYFVSATLLLCIFVWFRFKQKLEKIDMEYLIKADKLLLETVGQVAKIGGWKIDHNGRFVSWSQQCSAIIKQPTEFYPKDIACLQPFFSERDFLLIEKKSSLLVAKNESFDIEVALKLANYPPAWLRIMSDGQLNTKDCTVMGTLQDVTDKVVNAKLIEHQATFDSLTGLPNRLLYNDRLNLAIGLAQRKQQTIAVLFIDLDRFKPINDNHGHQAGDQVLIETAHRIKMNIRQSDTVSRLSGDEFAVILNDIQQQSDVAKLAEQIIIAIQKAYDLGDATVFTSASVGIAIYPSDGDSADSLLRKADQAMYEVKASGRNGSQFYTQEMKQRSETKHALLNDLTEAINKGKLQPYFQPIYHLEKNLLLRCESLARWIKDDGEFISPDQFIPIAEESGLINRIDHFMLKSAGKFLQEQAPDVELSINISPRLFHTKDKALDQWLVSIKKLSKNIKITVEITERLLTDDSDQALTVLKELQQYGVKIAIDDFGTGYSSLAYLIKYPVDIIKIDKSFVQDIGTVSTAETLIESILAMADRLGIQVVAEGIETKEQLEYLKKFGCNYGQGYYLARPLPPEKFLEHLSSN